jgi:hypothetical protein
MNRNRTLHAAAAFSELHASDPEAFGAIEAAVAPAEGGKPAQPTMSGVAYSGGLLNVDWGKPVVVDLTALRAEDSIVLLKDHDRRQLVGQATAQIKARSVTIAGNITGNVDDPSDPAGSIVMHARGGFRWPLSVGIWPKKVEEVAAGAKVNVNGRSFNGPLYVVRAGVLREVSFVTIGGDENASAKIAASAAGENTMEPTFVQWLTAQGKDAAGLSDADKAPLQAAYDALKTAGLLVAAAPAPVKPAEKPGDDDPMAALRASQAAEWKRQGMIAEKAGKYPKLAAQATEENWDEARLTAEVKIAELQAARPKAPPAGHGETHPVLTAEICAAAMCLKHNIGMRDAGKSLIASFGEETVNKADRYRGLRFSKMMEVVAAQAGVALPWEVGSHDWLQAAFSGSSIGSTILGAVANKALADVIAEPNWLAPRIAGVASHANFHSHTVYSLATNGDLNVVSPAGEINHLDLSAESWTRQLTTRGAILRVTRQDMINDDLGAFTRSAQTMARKAMNTREKALFTAINATATGTSHFTSARGNYLSGTAIGVSALDLAVKAFRNLKGADGDPIMVEPSILMVAPTNEGAAQRLLAAGGTIIATGLASTSAKTIEANANIYAGRFGGRPAVAPYLEAIALTGYSTTAFYLLADPAILPCFEIAYLNGQMMPTIEYFGLEHDIDTLGVSWRVYYDFGVGTAEWRAGVKSAGV